MSSYPESSEARTCASRLTRMILGALGAIGLVLGGMVGCENSINVSPAGDLSVPGQLTYRQIAVGGEDQRRLTLKNLRQDDGGSVTIRNVQLHQGQEDDHREFFVVGETEFPDEEHDDLTLAPGESVSWQIAYRPKNGGRDRGTVTFDVENDPDFDDEDVTVELETREMAPRLTFVPGHRLNFTTEAGEKTLKFVKLVNTGWADLQVDDIRMTGSTAFDVDIADPSDVSCAAGRTNPFVRVEQDTDGDGEMEEVPKAIGDVETLASRAERSIWPVQGIEGPFEPDACVTFVIAFEPSDNGAERADLVIESNANPATQSVSLAGNASGPCLEISTGDFLDFGVVTTGTPTQRAVRIENCRERADPLKVSGIELVQSGGVFSVESDTAPAALVDGDPSTTISLSGGEQTSFTVAAEPTEDGLFGSSTCGSSSGNPALVVRSNDPVVPSQRVCMEVVGDSNACPTAVAEAKTLAGEGGFRAEVAARPLQTVQLRGTNSSDPDGAVVRYEWTMLEKPGGSTARFVPSNNAEQPQMFLDLAGEYLVGLRVYDETGTASCGETATVKLRAVPREAIHVQLVWRTPADPDPSDRRGSDLDLHMVNPDPPGADGPWSWNEAPYDVFYENAQADWGAVDDPSDDPSLDIDDTNGAGPENINLDNPPATEGAPYKIGVYYYEDHGFGPSFATVRVFLDGELAGEYGGRRMADTYAFWHVVDLQWPSRTLQSRDRLYSDGFP